MLDDHSYFIMETLKGKFVMQPEMLQLRGSSVFPPWRSYTERNLLVSRRCSRRTNHNSHFSNFKEKKHHFQAKEILSSYSFNFEAMEKGFNLLPPLLVKVDIFHYLSKPCKFSFHVMHTYFGECTYKVKKI